MCVRFNLSYLALACLCFSTLGLGAHAAAEELDPALFEEWAARRNAVTVASQEAKSGRLDALLELLTQELTNPLPAELPHWPSNYTLSEIIQGRILQGLSQTPERGALVEAYSQGRENRPLEKRVVIALGLAGLVNLGEKEKKDQTVLKRCLALLREDKDDFIRARAARSLWKIGLANPDVIPQIEPALRTALTDPTGRPNISCCTAYGTTVYLVRGEVRSALLVLGFELAPGEGVADFSVDQEELEAWQATTPTNIGKLIRQQIAAVRAIGADADLSIEAKSSAIVGMLRQELVSPIDEPGKPALSSGYSLSEHLQVVYMAVVARTVGPKVIWDKHNTITQETQETDRELKKRLVFAFAFSSRYHDLAGLTRQRAHAIKELVKLLRTDNYDFVRALAARGLGRLQAKEEAAGFLKIALGDPEFRDVEGLMCIGGPGIGSKRYLVRLDAAMALKKMGFAISHPEWGVWQVEE